MTFRLVPFCDSILDSSSLFSDSFGVGIHGWLDSSTLALRSSNYRRDALEPPGIYADVLPRDSDPVFEKFPCSWGGRISGVELRTQASGGHGWCSLFAAMSRMLTRCLAA